MDGVGCDPTAENDSILACLRSADLATIKSVSSQIFAESEYQIVWPFQPITGKPSPLSLSVYLTNNYRQSSKVVS